MASRTAHRPCGRTGGGPCRIARGSLGQAGAWCRRDDAEAAGVHGSPRAGPGRGRVAHQGRRHPTLTRPPARTPITTTSAARRPPPSSSRPPS